MLVCRLSACSPSNCMSLADPSPTANTALGDWPSINLPGIAMNSPLLAVWDGRHPQVHRNIIPIPILFVPPS